MIREQLQAIRRRIEQAAIAAGRRPQDITLVAVSKRVPAPRLAEAMAAGISVFGENYLQEAADKIAALPGATATWHFIGGIQSNKVAKIASLFDVVETVDDIRVALALERHLAPRGKVMPVYLQVNIGREPQKSGVLPEEIGPVLRAIQDCPHLRLAGLMAMPPASDEAEASRPYFRATRQLAASLLGQGLVGQPLGLSMGMSHDFEIAIAEGATLVRIGTALFGERG